MGKHGRTSDVSGSPFKNKGGRPRKEINKDMFEILCGSFCTLAEIAGRFGVCDDSVEAWCKKTYGEKFSVVFKRYSSSGRASLRAKAFQMAMAGDRTMLIFLLKVYVGLREEINHIVIPGTTDEHERMAKYKQRVIETFQTLQKESKNQEQEKGLLEQSCKTTPETHQT